MPIRGRATEPHPWSILTRPAGRVRTGLLVLGVVCGQSLSSDLEQIVRLAHLVAPDEIGVDLVVKHTRKCRSPWDLYDRLLDAVPPDPQVREVVIGLTWTLCRGTGWGLAMSPGTPTRTLSWPGTLGGRSVRDLAAWVRSWDPYEATVGVAAINSAINADSDLAASATPLFPTGPANLAVFEHFAVRLAGKRVVVVGRYPGLETLELDWQLSILERQPGPGDLPDPAAEYLLPEADWVFLTATSIPNKTFPRLRPCKLIRNC